jgi:hypothetical protein
MPNESARLSSGEKVNMKSRREGKGLIPLGNISESGETPLDFRRVLRMKKISIETDHEPFSD